MLRCRLAVAKMTIIGVAEGIIMATIIIDHMMNRCGRSPGPQFERQANFKSISDPIISQAIWSMYAQASTVIKTRPERMSNRSFCSRFPISELFAMSDHTSLLDCPRKVRIEGVGAFCRQDMFTVFTPGFPGGDDLWR